MQRSKRFSAPQNDIRRASGSAEKIWRRSNRTPLITIVDDDNSMREAVTSLIRSIGFKAETFASSEEFVQCNHLREIACLILDVKMPGRSGLELQRQLSNANYNIPIVFITGRGDDRTREQALNAGAVEFLYKPFSEEALLKAINSALKI